MTACTITGYVASALVLAAFCMKEMVPLRIVALCSNLAFIAYGLGLGLTPIWLLHAVLLPMNVWRLCELRDGVSNCTPQAIFRGRCFPAPGRYQKIGQLTYLAQVIDAFDHHDESNLTAHSPSRD